MQLKFEGNSSIDANTLIGILVHYQSVANIANMTYSGGAKIIRVDVNAIEKGSFIIDLSVVQSTLSRMFSKDTIEYVLALTGIIYNVFALYRLLKGKPIKTAREEEDARTVINNYTNINVNAKVTINVYNQPPVREAISKSIEMADENPSVESFTVSDEHDEIIFPRSEFKEYIYDDFDNEEDIPNERTQDVDAVLTIIGLKFENNSRWQFMYNGFKISMMVKDDALMKKIDEGERFGKGDAIRVKMRILQKYNSEYKTYENVTYKIIEFKEHIITKGHPEIFEQ